MLVPRRVFQFLILLAATLSANAFSLSSAEIKLSLTDPNLSSQVSGLLYQPVSKGIHPAIIFLNDCASIPASRLNFSQQLSDWNYVSLHIFPSRDCFSLELHQELTSTIINAARNYLQQQNFVDPFRVGIAIWENDLIDETARIIKQESLRTPTRFRALIHFSYACDFPANSVFGTPTLVISGYQDESAAQEVCATAGLPQQQTTPLETRRPFDDPNFRRRSFFPQVFGPGGELFSGNPNTTEKTITINHIKSFLDQSLRYEPARMRLNDLPFAVTAAQAQHATWIRHPRDVGDALPTKGYSTFDLLFTEEIDGQRHYKIPFPIYDLMDSIEGLLAPGLPGVQKLRTAFIPHGRSLQKHAAKPNFFTQPRLLIVPDAEPITRNGEQAIYLKDRIFIAYQENAEVLEVISYNEQLNRFEFQVVEDYAPGKTPKVFYANRSLCIACHQNHAPIFPNAPWAETSSFPSIVAALKRQSNNFYGIPVGRNSVNAIDRSVIAASAALSYQTLWQKGCGLENTVEFIRCRAALMTAVLQFGLSQYGHFDRSSQEFKQNFRAIFSRNWQKHWPNGLLIPTANIPDRDPFLHVYELPPSLDPLSQRPAAEYWSHENEFDLERIIGGLSYEILQQDLYALDKFLVQEAEASGQKARQLLATCTLTEDLARSPSKNFSLECEHTDTAEFSLLAELHLINDHDSKATRFSGRGHWLDIGTTKGPTRFVFDEQSRRLVDGYQQLRLSLRFTNTDAHIRMPDGSSLPILDLAWPAIQFPQPPKSPSMEQPLQLKAKLWLVRDFEPVKNAMQKLQQQNINGDSQVLSSSFLDARGMMYELFTAMGAKPTERCCKIAKMPEPQLKPLSHGSQLNTTNVDAKDPLQLFYRHCARCHHTDTRFPPSFLSGSREQIKDNLQACAERIAVRLHMWDLSADARQRSPMPPIQMADYSHAGASALVQMKAYVVDFLATQEPSTILDELLSRPYQQLPECQINTP